MSCSRQKWAAFDAAYRADRAQRTGMPFTPRDARFEQLYAIAAGMVAFVTGIAILIELGGAR